MKYQRKPYPLQKHFVESRAGGPIPFDVIAERDHRHAQPQTLHMLLLGDPLPGRSALDLKRAAGSVA